MINHRFLVSLRHYWGHL